MLRYQVADLISTNFSYTGFLVRNYCIIIPNGIFPFSAEVTA
jgi:hypothetical protein